MAKHTGSLFDLIDRGRLGKNIGLSTGLSKLDSIISGIQRGIYQIIAGGTGSGKTTLALYSYIYRPIMDNLHNDNYKVIYMSLEMTSETLLAKLMSLYLYETYSVDISYDKILSRSVILSDSEYELVCNARNWLELVEKHLIIYDKSLTAKGLYAFLKKYARFNGEFVETATGDDYTPHVQGQYVTVIIDHIGLIHRSDGQSSKDAIDLTSKYLIYFRNKCGYSAVVLMQTNRQANSMDRRLNGYEEFEIQDLQGSSQPAQDAEVILALFNPYREKMSVYRDYKIKLIRDCFRSLLVLKNRYGEADKMVPLNFFGSIGYYKELPKPEEIVDYNQFVRLPGVEYEIEEEIEEEKSTITPNYTFSL